MPGFKLAKEHAVGNGSHLIRAEVLVVGAHHGSPDPSKNFAGKDLFQHAAKDRQPGRLCEGGGATPPSACRLSVLAHRFSRHFDAAQ